MKVASGKEQNQISASVILFDGVCNLCNHAVQTILKRDKKHYFKFASLQSDFAQKSIENHWLKTRPLPDSILLWENNKLYDRSAAVLKITKHLSGLWPVCSVFLLIPRFLRDAVYDFIARNRYKWFGKKNSCSLSEGKNLQNYFLD